LLERSPAIKLDNIGVIEASQLLDFDEEFFDLLKLQCDIDGLRPIESLPNFTKRSMTECWTALKTIKSLDNDQISNEIREKLTLVESSCS